jgi:CheY-like chemotaxis protein
VTRSVEEVAPLVSTQSRSDPSSSDELDSTVGDFGHLVRDALAHLYDTMHLQTHPLTRSLLHAPADKPSMLGKTLRRRLLDAIDDMRPPPGTASMSKIHRKYRILEMRYVEEIDPTEIQRQLAMSKTEYYREHGQALNAVISVLREQWGVSAPGKSDLALPNARSDALAEQEAREIGSRMQLEMLDLRDTVREVVGILNPLCRQQGVELELRSESSPCHAQADRVALRQALLNAIRKVMDAIAPGQVSIRVTSQATDVGIEIRGTFLGARPPAELPPDPSVARLLVECLRGQVQVESSDSIVVRIRLPTTCRLRLLVVDNSQDFVALVSRYLNQEHWEVIGAADAQRAIDIMETAVPDLILLDVMMPGCDGWEFLRQLKSSGRTLEIPVVVCSVVNDEMLAISLGADGYLLKPLSQSDLIQALRPWQVNMTGVGPEREGPPR